MTKRAFSSAGTHTLEGTLDALEAGAGSSVLEQAYPQLRELKAAWIEIFREVPEEIAHYALAFEILRLERLAENENRCPTCRDRPPTGFTCNACGVSG